MPTENDLMEQIAQYLNFKHPTVLYHFDLSGMWTSSHKARSLYGRLNQRAFPDLFIYKSTTFDGTVNPCAGLALELKREGNSPYLADGTTLKADKHVREQAAVLEQLADAGYYAVFATGFDEAVAYIEAYLVGDWRTIFEDGVPF